MPVYYAISGDQDDGYYIYGKGDSEDEAQEDAVENLDDGDPKSAALRERMIVIGRDEAEQRGIVPRTASVIWYAHLNRYQVDLPSEEIRANDNESTNPA